MSFLLKSSTRAFRPAISSLRTQTRFATSDYGSGAGNPAGERPEKQGKNPSESLEHPGPAPPKVAKGQSSSSPNNDDSSSSSGASKGSGKGEDGAADTNKDLGSSKKGARPKLAAEAAPAEAEQSEDVKRHNREMREGVGEGK